MVVLCPGNEVTIDQLPFTGLASTPAADDAVFTVGMTSLREVERDYIRYVLRRSGGNRSAAARILGIGRNTLLRKLREPED